jgi:hypothetical protein
MKIRLNEKAEINFLIKIKKELDIFFNGLLEIRKIKNPKNFIDFMIINNNNGKVLYLELKTLNKEKPYNDNHIINYTKIQQIKKHYPNSLLVFEYNNTNDLYYKYINNDDFLNYEKNEILEQLVYLIPTKDTNKGLSNLIDFIICNLNINN